MSTRDAFLVIFLGILMSKFVEHLVMATLRAWVVRRMKSTLSPEELAMMSKGGDPGLGGLGPFTPREFSEARANVRHGLDEQAYIDGWRACEGCHQLPPTGGGAFQTNDPESPENDHIMHHYKWDGLPQACKGRGHERDPKLPPPPPVRAA